VSKVINKKSEKIQAALSALTTKAQEVYSGIRIIHAFARSKQVLKEFEQKADDYRQKAISLNKVESYFQPLMLLMVGASTVLAIFIGGNEMNRGRFTAGNIAEFVYYINMLTWPVASLGWAISLVQRAEASQSRINEFLQQTPDILSPQNPESVTACENISFRNCTLQYPDTGIVALDNLNFSIRSGEKVAIVGRTGSGKSTLAELIMRNYDVSSGEILINGIDIRNLSLEQWREGIGYVAQDVFLFSDTITENIRFGEADATFDEIKRYAMLSLVHEDVILLPKGYDTIVGERGVMLSGGQKQRISIARALIRKPQLLIMDDCLSAVDADTETKILQNLFKIFKDKTVVFITHKTFVAQQFDRIFLLDEGKLTEQGTHHELLAKNGKYADLYHLQNAEKLHQL
jgi:ATP-binding cassette subfamily B protein